MSSIPIYTKTTNDFIKKSEALYPGRISSYEKAVYNGAKEPIVLECSEHGEFTTKPENHFNSFGCPECRRIKKDKYHASRIVVDVEEFKRRANELFGEGTYDYSKVDFKVQTERVAIICPEHGEFDMEARTHMRGRGCKECARSRIAKPKTREHFINKVKGIHGDRLDLTDSIYNGIEEPTTVRCVYHDYVHHTTPRKLYRGYGCLYCWYETIGNHIEIKSESENIPSTLYHIKIFRENGTSFEKVGITTKGLHRRFEAIKLEGFDYDIINKYDMPLFEAKQCEDIIMEDLIKNRNRYRIRDLKGTRTGGWTECFPEGTCNVDSIVESYNS